MKRIRQGFSPTEVVSGIADHVLSTGKEVVLQDAFASELFLSASDKKLGITTKNILQDLRSIFSLIGITFTVHSH